VLCGQEYPSNYPNGKTFPFFRHINANLFSFVFKEVSESGKEYKTIHHLFETWAKYWTSYLIYFDDLPEGSEVLATNKANLPVAWKYKNFIFIPGGNLDYFNQHHIIRDRVEYVKALTFFINNLDPYSIEPPWLNEIAFLNESKLLSEKNKINTELKQLLNKKRVFFAQNKELEQLFQQLCEDIGIKLTKIGTSDFVIKQINPPLIIELTGTKNNLTKDKIGQIGGHFIELKSKIGNCSKTLVINHERLTNPKKRNKLDSYAFGLYKSEDINVVSILEFVALYEKILLKEEPKEKMFDLLKG